MSSPTPLNNNKRRGKKQQEQKNNEAQLKNTPLLSSPLSSKTTRSKIMTNSLNSNNAESAGSGSSGNVSTAKLWLLGISVYILVAFGSISLYMRVSGSQGSNYLGHHSNSHAARALDQFTKREQPAQFKRKVPKQNLEEMKSKLRSSISKEAMEQEQILHTGGTKQASLANAVALQSNPERRNANAKNDVSHQQKEHELASLYCGKYHEELPQEAANEMVYWSDIPSDSSYTSPFRHHIHSSAHSDNSASNNDDESNIKYLTFEPDGGGWNNIRMAMETVVTMAHAMGRTLVLPPEQGMYLLRKGDGKQKTTFSFNDFFHMDSLHLEHDGLDIITMETFLKRMAMTGRLVNKETSKVEFPPGNRTDWNGLKNDQITKLKEYLRKVTDVRNWKPEQCIAAIPADASLGSINDMKQIHSDLLKLNIQPAQFKDRPTPVNAPLKERMSEALNRRKSLCLYDEDMQHASVVHFMCYHKERARLLTHFYGFLFFQDWRQDLWTKRFVRDHLRYVDEVQCAAAAVVRALRDRAKGRVASGGNVEGLFDSVHIRRGDFQFKKTKLSAEKLYEHSRDVLHENATLFIATDERDKAFFKPFADRYDVCFLDDFQHLFPNLNTNFYGMLDQIIASKGEVFVGTFFSTFTGYINRMRGYHIAKYKLPGYEDGTMESYYFVPENKKFVMKSYWPIQSSLFNREYPVAWRDIDQGIGELGYEGE